MLHAVVRFRGAGEKSRTPDLRITNALLYQLSYTGDRERPSGRGEAQILVDGRHFTSKGGSFFATATFFNVA